MSEMSETSISPLTDAIRAAAVTVHTPNEQVFGKIVGERDVQVWFAPGHYERVSVSSLEQELAGVARLLFAGALRERRRLTSELTGQVLSRRIPLGRRAEEYDEFLRELTVEETSDDGSLTVRAVGQLNFAVSIVAGTLDRVPAETFQMSCSQVAGRLIAETETAAARAKWRIFEPLPGLSLDKLGG